MISPSERMLKNIAETNKDFDLYVWPITADICAELARGMQYRMYGANVVRNSLLACGYTSLYNLSDDYPLKNYEKLATMLVHQSNSAKTNTSIGNYMENIELDLSPVDGTIDTSEFSIVVPSLDSTSSLFPLSKLPQTSGPIKYDRYIPLEYDFQGEYDFGTCNYEPGIAKLLKLPECKNPSNRKPATKDNISTMRFVLIITLIEHREEKFYYMMPRLYWELRTIFGTKIDLWLRVWTLIEDDKMFDDYERKFLTAQQEWEQLAKIEKWADMDDYDKHLKSYLHLFRIDLESVVWLSLHKLLE